MAARSPRAATVAAGQLEALWIVREVDHLGGRVGRTAGVVDDVVDGPHATQRDDHHVGEPYAGTVRHLEPAFGHNGWTDVEVAVAAHSPGLVRGHRVGHLVRGVPSGRAVHPGRLARWVVRHLVLVEVRTATVAVPDRLVLLVVLDEQAVHRDVVAVDDQAGVGGVDRPTDTAAVVGTPEPHVVTDDVVAVDDEARCRFAHRRTT